MPLPWGGISSHSEKSPRAIRAASPHEGVEISPPNYWTVTGTSVGWLAKSSGETGGRALSL